MADDVVVRRRVERTGLGLLQPADGLAGLSAVLSALCAPHAAVPVAAVVPVDWRILLKTAVEHGSVPAFFAEVAPAVLPAHRRSTTPRSSHQRVPRFTLTLAGAPAAPATEAAVQAVVLEVAQSVLGYAPPPDQPLMEAGLDSLGACCHGCGLLVDCLMKCMCVSQAASLHNGWFPCRRRRGAAQRPEHAHGAAAASHHCV